MRSTMLAAVCAVVALGGCKRLRTGAVEEFGRLWSCPEDRAEVRDRPELKFGDLLLARTAPATPPAEVRADPERLAKWEADQRARLQIDHLNDLEVYEVEGCGHRSFLACEHPRSSDGDGFIASAVACTVVPDAFVPEGLRKDSPRGPDARPGPATPGTKAPTPEGGPTARP